VLVRDDDKATLDRCVACPPYTYSVEEAIYGQKMSVGQGEEIVCNPCPRGKATCTGRNDISPNPGNAYVSVCVRVSVSVFVHVLRKLYGVCMWAIGYWSPLSGSTFDTSVRREGHESTGANGSLVVNIYRCVPPTACLGRMPQMARSTANACPAHMDHFAGFVMELPALRSQGTVVAGAVIPSTMTVPSPLILSHLHLPVLNSSQYLTSSYLCTLLFSPAYPH